MVDYKFVFSQALIKYYNKYIDCFVYFPTSYRVIGN